MYGASTGRSTPGARGLARREIRRDFRHAFAQSLGQRDFVVGQRAGLRRQAGDMRGAVRRAARTCVTDGALREREPHDQHALVQHNLQRLRAAGVYLYDAGIPDPTGATDELGWSLSAPKVVDTVAECLLQTTALTGKVVIITAGPTQEPIDPVRHISNRASGRTGFALAEAARRRGARVIGASLFGSGTVRQLVMGIDDVLVRSMGPTRNSSGSQR